MKLGENLKNFTVFAVTQTKEYFEHDKLKVGINVQEKRFEILRCEDGLNPGLHEFPFEFEWPNILGTFEYENDGKIAHIINYAYLQVIKNDAGLIGSCHKHIFVVSSFYNSN